MAQTATAGTLQRVRERVDKLCREVLHKTPAEANELTQEYLKFMQLKVEHGHLEPGVGLAPSPQIDEVWHAHVLDTRSYEVFQQVLLPGGGRIHHNPVLSGQPDYEQRLAHTLNLYLATFGGDTPPYSIWSGDDGAVKQVLVQTFWAREGAADFYLGEDPQTGLGEYGPVAHSTCCEAAADSSYAITDFRKHPCWAAHCADDGDHQFYGYGTQTVGDFREALVQHLQQQRLAGLAGAGAVRTMLFSLAKDGYVVNASPLKKTRWWEDQEVVLVIFKVPQAPAPVSSRRLVTFVNAAGTELVPNGIHAAPGTLLRALLPSTWPDGSVMSLQDVDLAVQGSGVSDVNQASMCSTVAEWTGFQVVIIWDRPELRGGFIDPGLRIVVSPCCSNLGGTHLSSASPLRITCVWSGAESVNDTPPRYFHPTDTVLDVYRHCKKLRPDRCFPRLSRMEVLELTASRARLDSGAAGAAARVHTRGGTRCQWFQYDDYSEATDRGANRVQRHANVVRLPCVVMRQQAYAM
ncbi:hypothetical protein JKP88DRAFT_250353 [Tribonema minus]|uniref:Uncharacterized protein n=1 Tax=Tribonema minus TaxID=303371 RepID=A0A836C7Y6_9STRA|nr:hypothetical protein JKP88DRAFT_250353 [Tribonema minus]